MQLFIQLFLLFALFSNIHSEDEVIQIKRLRKELLEVRKYDKWSRPVKQHRTPTWLKMSITVVHLTDLDIVKHTLTSEVWLRMAWVDEHLKFDPSSYGGLKEIHFGSDELWKPDISLWNSADQYNLDNLSKVHLIVSSNGTVEWTPTGTLRTSCDIDLTDYPFDLQECELYFGSWSHNQEQINFTTSGEEFIDTQTWYTNPEWEIISSKAFRHNYNYPEYGDYTSLDLTLKLKRNSSFYYYIITLPSIASMALILAIFWLPSHSSARFTLGSISLFVSFSTLLYLGLQLGSASFGVPIAVRNLSLLVSMVGIALVLSTLSQHIFAACLNSSLRVPKVLVNQLNGVLANILCINNNCIIGSKQIMSDRIQLTSEESDGSNFDTSSDTTDDNEKEWKLVFIFIDRLLFWVYFIVFIAKHA